VKLFIFTNIHYLDPTNALVCPSLMSETRSVSRIFF